jgi:signal transduction histidine kinase
MKYLQTQLRTQEKFAVLGEAAAYTAHNIQNPLAGIRAAAQVTLNNTNHGQEEVRQCLGDIIESVDRLDIWVKRFLSYAKPLELLKVSTNLNSEVEETLSLTYRKFANMGINVETHLDKTLGHVFLDPVLMQQAISAIMANSFESGGKKVVIKTEKHIDDDGTDWAMVAISDNGQGISVELKNRLFNTFVTNKKGGTGLGLAQAKKIIDLHGGELFYESKPTEGTVFFIKLPLAAEIPKTKMSERKHGTDSNS